MAVIESDRLTKRFGNLAAVKEATFEVEPGTIFGLLGANGAGKSTLIRMLTTLLLPSSGTGRVSGFDVVREPEAVRRSIGVIPQARTSDLDLTAAENIHFYAGLFSFPLAGRRQRVNDLLATVGLAEWGDEIVRTFSGGMVRRLEIARSLLHQPKILFLDEPSAGLDPASRTAMWDMMRRLQSEIGLTIVLTTHYMEEADLLCDRIAMLHRGQIVKVDTPAELKASVPTSRPVEARFDSPPAGWREAILALKGTSAVEISGERYLVDGPDAAATASLLLRLASERNVGVSSLNLERTTLNDVYFHYAGHDLRPTLSDS
jgi:ABC-2 type transport system ATP-binding protein